VSTDIVVKVIGKEKVTVPAGTFDCFVIEPIMEAGGLFKNSGKLTIWITDDNRRIPVLMKSKIPVGSIDAVLQEFRPGGSAEARAPPPFPRLPPAPEPPRAVRGPMSRYPKSISHACA
jgi:hypothetical protein